jgi:hypothetical protein
MKCFFKNGAFLIRENVFDKRVSEALAIGWRREGQLRKLRDVFVKH